MQSVLKRKNMYSNENFLRNIVFWACLLHEDLYKLKSSTEENIFYSGIVVRISFFLIFKNQNSM